MGIELIVGITGALIISGYFVIRENNKKQIRGEILTGILIKESIIPLRKKIKRMYLLLPSRYKIDTDLNEIHPVIDNPKNEITALERQKLKEEWYQIQKDRVNISTLFIISGEVIQSEQQIILSKILAELEKDWESENVSVLADTNNRLHIHLTEFLKINKKLVKEYTDNKEEEHEKSIENFGNLGIKYSDPIMELCYAFIKIKKRLVGGIIKDQN